MLEPIVLRGLLPAKYPAHFSGLAFQNFSIPGETISNLWIFVNSQDFSSIVGVGFSIVDDGRHDGPTFDMIRAF